MESLDLSNRVALISAGTRGIGEAVAANLAKQGATVVAFSRSAEQSEIQVGTGKIVTLATDGTNYEQLQSLVKTITERFGKIDILVNNTGGVPYYGPIIDAQAEMWDSSMEVNLRSAFLLTKIVVKEGMGENGGSIVNIASVAGLRGGATGLGIYGVAKAAMIMLTKQLARELGPNHIRVNAIAPGLIKTEFSRTLWENPRILQAVLSSNPSGRLGTAEDIARAVTFLASDAADYINGEILVVDGGNLA